MSSAGGKEQFMKQFDAIVEGVKQNKVKVSTGNIELVILGRLAYIHMARCRPVDIHTHG
jgi:sarcosine oxidase gamma subunit